MNFDPIRSPLMTYGILAGLCLSSAAYAVNATSAPAVKPSTPGPATTLAPTSRAPSFRAPTTRTPTSLAPTTLAPTSSLGVLSTETYGLENNQFDENCADLMNRSTFQVRGIGFRFSIDQVKKLCEVKAPEHGGRYYLSNYRGPYNCVTYLFKRTYTNSNDTVVRPLVDPEAYLTTLDGSTPYIWDVKPEGLPLTLRGVTEACASAPDTTAAFQDYLTKRGECIYNLMALVEYEEVSDANGTYVYGYTRSFDEAVETCVDAAQRMDSFVTPSPTTHSPVTSGPTSRYTSGAFFSPAAGSAGLAITAGALGLLF